MNKVTKKEFNRVWKDTSKKGILNQFYYEHYDLLDLQQRIDNINKLLIKERNYHIEGSLEYKLIDEIIEKVNKEIIGKDENN